MTDKEETPVYMVVIGNITDRDKMGRYQKALMESGLYPRYGGYYIAAGKPVEMFEGDWPESNGMVIARFPSRDAARKFWNSEIYQEKIKPLREGAGTFQVSLFPDISPPPE